MSTLRASEGCLTSYEACLGGCGGYSGAAPRIVGTSWIPGVAQGCRTVLGAMEESTCAPGVHGEPQDFGGIPMVMETSPES